MCMELTVQVPLRRVTGSKTVTLPAVDHEEPVRNVLDRFVEAYPQAEAQLLDEEGTPKGSVSILVDGERAKPTRPVRRQQRSHSATSVRTHSKRLTPNPRIFPASRLDSLLGRRQPVDLAGRIL
jgi:hypothetical protein